MKIVTRFVKASNGSALVEAKVKGKKVPKVSIGFHSEQDPHLAAAQKLMQKLGIEFSKWAPCYKVQRVFFNGYKTQTLKKGLSLEEAQKHCKDPETSSSTCTNAKGLRRTKVSGPWFDSWTQEGWVLEEKHEI